MKLYVIFLFLTFKIYGQAPLKIEVYLNSEQVSKTAKDFYYGKFKASDNTKTFSIIDSLMTKNNITRPFYIFLVSKMMDKSDGALSEVLVMSCKEFIEFNPNFLIDFLYSDNKIIKNKFYNNWAYLIAGEFMISCEGDEKRCIKESLLKTSKKITSDNKSRLTKFYHKIESYCHL